MGIYWLSVIEPNGNSQFLDGNKYPSPQSGSFVTQANNADTTFTLEVRNEGSQTDKQTLVVRVDKTTKVAFYLYLQPSAAYAGIFGQFITGHLIQLTNPNLFRIALVLPGHTADECITNPSACIVLGAGASTSSQDIVKIYGTVNPTLPVAILASAEVGATPPNVVRIDVTYSYSG